MWVSMHSYYKLDKLQGFQSYINFQFNEFLELIQLFCGRFSNFWFWKFDLLVQIFAD